MDLLRRVLVLGFGVAGKSAQAALEELQVSHVVYDPHGNGDVTDLAEVNLAEFSVAIASPGIPPHASEIKLLQQAGVPIWSEMEFAWQVRNPATQWILITGTNGKTTTTQMTGAILATAGKKVAVCGNMGNPVITAARGDYDVLAVEIASLHLHFTHSLSPIAAVCLNADNDHLDWHGSVANYRAAKARVYQHVQAACVYPAGNEAVRKMVAEADVVEGARAIGITLGAPEVGQMGIVADLIVDRAFIPDRHRAAEELAGIDDLAHLAPQGVPSFLVANALTAAALARAVGVGPEAVRRAFREFQLDAHRTAWVAEIAGTHYVDDSKATNAHAVRAAFGDLPPRSVVWIAGGVAKGQHFDELVADIRAQLRAVVLIGENPEPLRGALQKHAADIPLTYVEPGETVMRRAVAEAARLAQPGDTVLLSPACASLDQFESYSERGQDFVDAVKALAR